MPLLGRHKSLPGSPTGNKQQPAVAAQPLVCESPLFGTRRQLPVASSATPTSTSRTTTTTTTSNTTGSSSTRPNLTARCSSPLETSRRSAAISSPDDTSPLINSSSSGANQHLGSIPKQITRQQIHYAFSIMDGNSDGLVDVRDLSQMLANLGVPIDEAILSHVMSTVSKRGDHRISEQEFLDWIGNVIQVSDASSSAGQSVGGEGSRRRAVAPSSSSPSSSLVAQSAEAQALVAQQMRRRRGSGSGLALMRSLSGSSLAGQQALRNTNSESTENVKEQMEQKRRAEVDEQQQEARNDLKAAFCVFDLDGDGYITIDEVQQGLKLLGESWTQTELNQLLFSKCNNTNESKVNRRDLSARQQRISIDDFVKLLL